MKNLKVPPYGLFLLITVRSFHFYCSFSSNFCAYEETTNSANHKKETIAVFQMIKCTVMWRAKQLNAYLTYSQMENAFYKYTYHTEAHTNSNVKSYPLFWQM